MRLLLIFCTARLALCSLYTWHEPVFAVNSSKNLVYGYATYGCKILDDVNTCQTNHTILPHSGGLHRGILTLDLYTPTRTTTAAGLRVPSLKPAMILMHGGSYVNGASYSDNMPHSASWYHSLSILILSSHWNP